VRLKDQITIVVTRCAAPRACSKVAVGRRRKAMMGGFRQHLPTPNMRIARLLNDGKYRVGTRMVDTSSVLLHECSAVRSLNICIDELSA
jgi:hypothetical protein